MKCVLFCRVSSKEQEDTGFSLSAQERLLKQYTNKKDLTITKTFSISESASGKSQRETFKQMMSFVRKQDIKIIVCEKVDRLTRNFKDAVLLDGWLEKDGEREIHLVKDSLTLHKNSKSQEKLNWGIRILFAKNYTDNLSEEVKKGYMEKVKQGWMPHQPPIGYKSVGEKGRKIHVIDDKQAPYVKKVFRLYASGNYPIKKLEKVMFKAGFRSKRGNKIHDSKIHEILTNPFYIGKFKWADKVHNGKQKPLVSKEMFEKVQSILSGRSTPMHTRHNHLLKSLVRCKECKGTIAWEKQKRFVYGHCNHHKKCSQKTWVKEDEIEGKLTKVFDNLKIQNPTIHSWIKKALKESHKEEIEYYSNSVQKLNKKHESAKNRLDKLYDEKLDGKISESFYNKKFEQYSKEKDVATEALQKHSKADTKFFKQGMDIFNLSQRLQNAYGKTKKNDNKRQLFRHIFSKITLDEGKIEYEFTPAFKLLHSAVKMTNKSSKEFILRKKSEDIFEPLEKTENMGNYGQFLSLYPVVGTEWDKFRTFLYT